MSENVNDKNKINERINEEELKSVNGGGYVAFVGDKIVPMNPAYALTRDQDGGLSQCNTLGSTKRK